MKCWGSNVYGQLGYGHTNNIGDDESVSTVGNVSLAGASIMVTTGNRHTCALLSDNTVSCFGDNSFGQLGYGHTLKVGDDEVPSSVTLVDTGYQVSNIYAGNLTTCAISMDGQAKCWGRNNAGQLGMGHMLSIGDDELPSSSGYIALGKTVDQVGGGLNHHCFVTKDDGLVKCIGDAAKGQLGNGSILDVGDDELPSGLGFLSLMNL